jgi:ATP-binding cassette subfamily B (MDR/TAP) protein 1
MLGSFLALYCILTLYGTSLFYRDVEDTGCDPSAGVEDNESCESTGPDVFGAMLGIAFAAQGISQFGNFSEAFSAARVAVYEALQSMHRVPGAPEEIIYKQADDDLLGSTTRSKKSASNNTGVEDTEPVVRAILPKYEIDSTSAAGQKPTNIRGDISVKDVRFSYPTRPGDPILKSMNCEIAAGQTVAFVGKHSRNESIYILSSVLSLTVDVSFQLSDRSERGRKVDDCVSFGTFLRPSLRFD